MWATLPTEHSRAQQSRERDKVPFLPCILPNFNYAAYGVPGLLDHHQAFFFFANTHVPYAYILSSRYWKRRVTAHIVFVLESCSPPIHSPPSLSPSLSLLFSNGNCLRLPSQIHVHPCVESHGYLRGVLRLILKGSCLSLCAWEAVHPLMGFYSSVIVNVACWHVR